MNYLKYLIAKIEVRIKQSRCFKWREKAGMAAFGMCKGHYHEDKTPYKSCSICPYFVNVKEGAE